MVRLAVKEDLDEIFAIYAYARDFMKRTGNPTQWGDNRPPREAVLSDIEKKQSYIVEQNGQIVGVFAFILGKDPTYDVIEGGAWLNDEPYGTIHRIAGNGKGKGVLKEALDYAEKRTGNIRIDTHEDNFVMRSNLVKNGFKECGIIYVDNGTQRVAYQKVI